MRYFASRRYNSNVAFGNYYIRYVTPEREEGVLQDRFVSFSGSQASAEEQRLQSRQIKLMPTAPSTMEKLFNPVRPTSGTGAHQDAERKVVAYLYNQLIPLLTDKKQEAIAQMLRRAPRQELRSFPTEELNISGLLNIYTEMSPCSACEGAIGRIREIFQNKVRVNVRYGVVFRE
jgi:hypothetical protein